MVKSLELCISCYVNVFLVDVGVCTRVRHTCSCKADAWYLHILPFLVQFICFVLRVHMVPLWMCPHWSEVPRHVCWYSLRVNPDVAAYLRALSTCVHKGLCNLGVCLELLALLFIVCFARPSMFYPRSKTYGHDCSRYLRQPAFCL